MIETISMWFTKTYLRSNGYKKYECTLTVWGGGLKYICYTGMCWCVGVFAILNFHWKMVYILRKILRNGYLFWQKWPQVKDKGVEALAAHPHPKQIRVPLNLWAYSALFHSNYPYIYTIIYTRSLIGSINDASLILTNHLGLLMELNSTQLTGVSILQVLK